ncbi:cation diffusion facilitator family transporter [Oceanobacillus halophilus]|uniref:Cation transporter n=1 Tax=Oceanobacillus halophilus TaxID=930130 RepID=A0A495ABE4_9BACI|nr:cation diffusion facilitator family transporter [Oceanobacillus halophilus]RKQ37336.1 cation transporter [Oceanobacillus halophilus]
MGHHHHDHQHAHNHTTNTRVLFWSFIIIFSYMIIEVIGGLLTNSLALLSDAGHMLSDAAALGLSLFAFKIGEKKATQDKTFGYRRFEIVAAFINGITLIVISIIIFYEAYWRFLEPPSVNANMMFIASIGLIVNIVVAFLLHRGDSKENLNVRSALLHVMGDLLGSVGAITAGILIFLFGWNIADPIASVVVAFLIIISGIRVTKESLHILMEGKPQNVNINHISETIMNVNGVLNVHDLHVWSITSEFPTLSCHVVVQESINRDNLLHEINELIYYHFNIAHCTIQMEGSQSEMIEHCSSCD